MPAKAKSSIAAATLADCRKKQRKQCAQCGKNFYGYAVRLYCGTNCRSTAYYRKKTNMAPEGLKP